MNIIKAVRKKVKQMVDPEERKENKKLNTVKKELERAISEHNTFRQDCAEWDELYNGTKAVGKNVGRYMSDRSKTDTATSVQDARQNVNIVLQLIEAQIDISVPKPSVDAIEGDDGDLRRKMVEGQLTYMSEGTELLRVNSENERIVKKNSMAVYKVGYDPDHRSHKFFGRIKTINPHPVNVIPQPGQFRVTDMDYLFHIENRTIPHIVRKYKDEYKGDLRADLEEDGSKEYVYLDDFSDTTHDTNTNNDKYSVVEKWYMDDDGDVGLYTYCGYVVLRDIPKFFYKRDKDGGIVEFEEIELDEPVQMQETDEKGELLFDANGKAVMTQTTTVKVKAHVPRRFPFVIQYNIPKEKSYRGKSDPEIISDQQEGIKKMLSIEEEKAIKGTTKIFTRTGSGLKDKITSGVTQIIETENPSADMQVVQMHTNESSYKDLYEIYLQAAKDLLGITEASQGRAEGGNLSGKALEALAQYTAGRLSIKQFEKNIAYMELYSLYYDFLLAYYDEKRPYRIEGKDSQPEFGYFDKAQLIKQDDAGEWYYPDFDIYIGIDTGLPKDKRFIMESANESGDRMDNIEYWMVMESIGYPNAGAILDREREKEAAAMEQAKQQAQAQVQPTQPQQPDIEQVLSRLTPEQQEAFRQQYEMAGEDEKEAMIAELLSMVEGVTP